MSVFFVVILYLCLFKSFFLLHKTVFHKPQDLFLWGKNIFPPAEMFSISRWRDKSCSFQNPACTHRKRIKDREADIPLQKPKLRYLLAGPIRTWYLEKVTQFLGLIWNFLEWSLEELAWCGSGGYDWIHLLFIPPCVIQR